MLHTTNKIALTLLAALAVVSCTKVEPTAPTPSVPDAIIFSPTDVETIDKGRGATLVGSGAAGMTELRKQDIGVFGNCTQGGSTIEMFDNVKVGYNKWPDNDNHEGWSYNPIRSWEGGQYEFRAYWPATVLVEGTATAENLAIRYDMTTTTQTDLMVARHACASGNNGQPVPLKFRHALSAVSVKFQKGDGVHYTYTIKQVYFTGLMTRGALIYNSDVPDVDLSEEWWVDPASRGTSTIPIRNWTGNKLVPTKSNINNYEIDWELMIPQSLVVAADEEFPSVTFVVEMDWGTGSHEVTTTMPLPTTGEGVPNAWKAGKMYSYLITVQPNTADIEVITTDWDVVNAYSEDIIL